MKNGSDELITLRNLRADEQYEKLNIGPHTLLSISRAIQGKAILMAIVTKAHEVFMDPLLKYLR